MCPRDKIQFRVGYACRRLAAGSPISLEFEETLRCQRIVWTPLRRIPAVHFWATLSFVTPCTVCRVISNFKGMGFPAAPLRSVYPLWRRPSGNCQSGRDSGLASVGRGSGTGLYKLYKSVVVGPLPGKLFDRRLLGI